MRTKFWAYYFALTVTIGGLYVFGPDQVHVPFLFHIIGLSAAVAIVVGVRLHKPAQRLPWYLFAVAQALFVTGDIIAYNYPKFFGKELPFPSFADPFYLSVYPALIVGLLLIIRRRTPERDGASLLDSIIITVGIATLSWVYLMSPYARDETLSLGTKLISLSYPLMDISVLMVCIRLAVGGGRRSPSFYLLGAGFVSLFITDAIYGWLLLNTEFSPGGPIDTGWILFYALLGTAALHPTMASLADRIEGSDQKLTLMRVTLLGGATLLVPGVQVLRHVLDQPLDLMVLTAAAATLFTLVVMRMVGLVRWQERARQCEITLREAGEALVVANSKGEIYRTAIDSASELVGGKQLARLYLLDDISDTLIARAASENDLPPDESPTLRFADFTPKSVELLLARRTATFSFDADGTGKVSSGVLAPLFIRDELRGVLAVFGERAPTGGIRNAISTLAVEVALAMESAVLTEDLVRREAEARFGALVRHASDVISIVAPDSRVKFVSPASEKIIGRSVEDLIGANFVSLVHEEDKTAFLGFLSRLTSQSEDRGESSSEFRINHGDGSVRYVETLGTSLLTEPTVAGIVLNIRDVSERKAFETELARQAFHDTLTGLPNRALFRDRVGHAYQRCERSGEQIAVLFMDVDDFKNVNDSLGHAAGDQLLCEVGRRIESCLRRTDTAARLGGDEFAILLDGVTEITAVEIAETVLAEVSVPFQVEGQEVFPQASVGIALSSGADEGSYDPDVLLRNADSAMYLAKEHGKSRAEVFEASMHAAALDRLELKADLQRAIANDEFMLVYQPTVELDTEEISGCEALVRWEHPERGVVSPGQFIPLAEETGLIVQLGDRILQHACEKAVELQKLCPRDKPFTMAVNVSARQMQRANFASEVRRILVETGIPPRSLVLELTESEMMENMELAIARMEELRALGVQLALDDFGTGYSSLNYVRQLPIDILKVDRSFIQDIDQGTQMRALTAAIMKLAHILKLKTVAEGIETEGQLNRVKEMGCPYGQGFYFYRPLPADVLEGHLRAQAEKVGGRKESAKARA